MFRNYLKVALRNIVHSKTFTLINVVGLSVGMTCAVMIFLWVQDERGFDRFHANEANLYRVVHEKYYSGKPVRRAMTPPPLGGSLKNDFPEIVDFTRYSTFVGEILLASDDRTFYERGGAYVDPSFLKMFSFPLLKGNPDRVLEDRFSVLLTEATAQKYFGDTDPIGKNLKLENFCNLKVTGILKNIPHDSHLQFDFLVPFTLLEQWGADLSDWTGYPQYTYVQLRDDATAAGLEDKISTYPQRINADLDDRLELQPLALIHLYSNLALDNYAVLGNYRLVYVFIAVAVLVLVIACINFINLATAGYVSRAREIGVRKVFGADRFKIIRQFYGETLLLSILISILALVMIELTLPLFSEVSGKQLAVNFLDFRFISTFIGVALFTGIFSGAYPALFLSSFKPMAVIRNQETTGGGRLSWLKKSLVTFQFVLSLSLLICTAVLYKQLTYIDRTISDKDCVVYIQTRAKLAQQYNSLKNEMLNHPDILSVSATSNIVGAVPATSVNMDWPGKDVKQDQIWGALFVDFDYFKTMNLEPAEGRFFSKDIILDSVTGFVVNEKAAALIGGESPVGREFAMGDRRGEIIGVVRDYHYTSLHQVINPLVIEVRREFCNYLLIRINPASLTSTVSDIRGVWERQLPEIPFKFQFLDEAYSQMYRVEERAGKIFLAFTILAVFISALGLFGIISLVVKNRTREIGIRKVMGGSVTHIVRMLTGEIVLLLIIANVIAWPLAYLAVSRWLEMFAYRTGLSLTVFVAAAAVVGFVTCLSVVGQVFRAALSNPVDALRHE